MDPSRTRTRTRTGGLLPEWLKFARAAWHFFVVAWIVFFVWFIAVADAVDGPSMELPQRINTLLVAGVVLLGVVPLAFYLVRWVVLGLFPRLWLPLIALAIVGWGGAFSWVIQDREIIFDEARAWELVAANRAGVGDVWLPPPLEDGAFDPTRMVAYLEGQWRPDVDARLAEDAGYGAWFEGLSPAQQEAVRASEARRSYIFADGTVTIRSPAVAGSERMVEVTRPLQRPTYRLANQSIEFWVGERGEQVQWQVRFHGRDQITVHTGGRDRETGQPTRWWLERDPSSPAPAGPRHMALMGFGSEFDVLTGGFGLSTGVFVSPNDDHIAFAFASATQSGSRWRPAGSDPAEEKAAHALGVLTVALFVPLLGIVMLGLLGAGYLQVGMFRLLGLAQDARVRTLIGRMRPGAGAMASQAAVLGIGATVTALMVASAYPGAPFGLVALGFIVAGLITAIYVALIEAVLVPLFTRLGVDTTTSLADELAVLLAAGILGAVIGIGPVQIAIGAVIALLPPVIHKVRERIRRGS